MFTKRSVVSRRCIFDMNVYYVCHELALSLLGDGWCNVIVIVIVIFSLQQHENIYMYKHN